MTRSRLLVQRDAMEKADGAFLTISELANELDLPQHILRYWETRFPQLKPLQRSGNRRYYRPADVAIARHIHHLLHVEGFTVKGARKVLADGHAAPSVQDTSPPKAKAADAAKAVNILSELERIRDRLAAILGAAEA